jgi:hypothetical protein
MGIACNQEPQNKGDITAAHRAPTRATARRLFGITASERQSKGFQFSSCIECEAYSPVVESVPGIFSFKPDWLSRYHADIRAPAKAAKSARSQRDFVPQFASQRSDDAKSRGSLRLHGARDRRARERRGFAPIHASHDGRQAHSYAAVARCDERLRQGRGVVQFEISKNDGSRLSASISSATHSIRSAVVYDGAGAVVNAIEYAQFYSRSHHAVNAIEAHEHVGGFHRTGIETFFIAMIRRAA